MGTNLFSYNYFCDVPAQGYILQQKFCWGVHVSLRFLYVSGVEGIYQCVMLLKIFCKAIITSCQLGTLTHKLRR